MSRQRLPALVGAALLAGAIVGVACHALQAGFARAVPGVTLLARPGDGAAPASARQAVPTIGPVSAASAAVAARPPASQPVWDLCDVGRMPMPAGHRGTPEELAQVPRALLDLPLQDLGERTVSRLAQGTPRERAAAAFVEARLSGQPHTVPVALDLAAIGEAHRDAAVLSWALALCRDDRACRVDVARRWTRLEPENLAAWLPLLGDAEASDEARRAIGRTTRHRQAMGVLTDVVVSAAPADAPRYLRQALNLFVLGIEAAVPVDFAPLVRLCPRAGSGADEAARCGHLARVLVWGSDSLVAHGLGLRFAEHSDWTAASLQAMRDDRHRIEAGMTHAKAATFPEPYTCKAVDMVDRITRWRAAHGEVEAFRRAAPKDAAR
jgi:hypothetical protein